MTRVLRKRLNFGKIPPILDIPNLIEIQEKSYEKFLQKDVLTDKRDESGLQAAFLSVFPILDYNETASIEFLGYVIGAPPVAVEAVAVHAGPEPDHGRDGQVITPRIPGGDDHPDRDGRR